MSEKTYAKGIYFKEKTVKGRQVVSIVIDLKKFGEFVKENKTDNDFIRLDAWKNDQPDKFDNTHSILLNTYVPEKKKETEPKDDLPF